MSTSERAEGVCTEEWAPWDVVMAGAPANALWMLAGRRAQISRDPVFGTGVAAKPAEPPQHSAKLTKKLIAERFFLGLVLATVDAGRPAKSAKIAHGLCDGIRPETTISGKA